MAAKRVLFGILNWGIGHATRSIPIIRELQEQGCEVTLASDGQALALLKEEFPDLRILETPPYNIHYQKRGNFTWVMLYQFPKILTAVRREKMFVQKLVKDEHFDLIFSDNRYGFYAKKVYSIIMTHQLHIIMPAYLGVFGPMVRYWVRSKIRRFNQCWVPDFSKKFISLSGKLGQVGKRLKNVHYIGPISRFERSIQKPRVEIDLLCVLSGPEPQRSILEEKLMEEMRYISGRKVLIRGLPELGENREFIKEVERINFLKGEELKELMEKSLRIICRSGYTSLMDLYILGKNGLLIPTPGQTEQEYLAEYLYKKGLFLKVNQEQADLGQTLMKADLFPGFEKSARTGKPMKKIIRDLLGHLV